MRVSKRIFTQLSNITTWKSDVSYIQLWDQLLLQQDVLFCRLPSPTGQGSCDKLVVPKSLCVEVLKELHEGTVGGHLGSEKTLWKKLKEHFYWPGHYTEVQNWCNTCAVCSMQKKPNPKPKAKLCPVTVSTPMVLIAVDILGLLPESFAGNSYVLVIGDYFTKWMEVYPIANQDAITVNKLVNEFICRFSVPKQLHSDQGAQFESRVVAEVCKLLHIDKTRTTLYHPQSDGLIERFNRMLVQVLATCTDNPPF